MNNTFFYDLIIGAHAHVPQPYEDYNGGRIYYSLGNANYRVEEGEGYPASRKGICVKLSPGCTDHYMFSIDENGNIDGIIEEKPKELKKYSSFHYYSVSAPIYLTKNIRAFFRRIRMFGMKHFIIMMAWLVHYKTLKYYPFLLLRFLRK